MKSKALQGEDGILELKQALEQLQLQSKETDLHTEEEIVEIQTEEYTENDEQNEEEKTDGEEDEGEEEEDLEEEAEEAWYEEEEEGDDWFERVGWWLDEGRDLQLFDLCPFLPHVWQVIFLSGLVGQSTTKWLGFLQCEQGYFGFLKLEEEESGEGELEEEEEEEEEAGDWCLWLLEGFWFLWLCELKCCLLWEVFEFECNDCVCLVREKACLFFSSLMRVVIKLSNEIGTEDFWIEIVDATFL